MSCIFADTSFYVALANSKDSLHDIAVCASNQWDGKVVTSEYILLELGNYLHNLKDRKVFLDLFQAIHEDEDTQVIPASTPLLEKGISMYANRPDKEWSLTDCISFVIMAEQGISEALAADHHFEQAGYRILLSV